MDDSFLKQNFFKLKSSKLWGSVFSCFESSVSVQFSGNFNAIPDSGGEYALSYDLSKNFDITANEHFAARIPKFFESTAYNQHCTTV